MVILFALSLMQPALADKNGQLPDQPPPDGSQKLNLPDGRTGTETVTTTKAPDGTTVTVLDQKTSRNKLGKEQVRIKLTWVKNAAGNIESITRTEDTSIHNDETKDESTGKVTPAEDDIGHKETKRTYDPAGGFTETTTDRTTVKESGRSATEDETITEETFDANGKQLTGKKTVKRDGVERPSAGQTYDPAKRSYVDDDKLTPQTPLLPASPTANSAGGNETAYLPDVAGPTSQVVATFYDPGASGPSDVMLAMIKSDGTTEYYHARTDTDHHVAFRIIAGVASVMLFKGFHDGKPDDAAATCEVAQTATVPQTDALSSVPDDGPAIARASTAYERGGSSHGLMSIQTRGTDPTSTRLLLDGQPSGIETLASSDMSVKGRFADDVGLGRHSVSLESSGKQSNAFPTDVVTLRTDPVPPGEPGTVETLTVHCDGLPPADAATMSFAIGGAAQLASGEQTTTVPVENGVASVNIRGVRPGAALVRFHMRASIPGF
jgi:hypothetical protein